VAYIYRYTDLADGIIKYVGIVWGKTRSLQQRINEHERNDEWCFVRRWKIEYIEIGINNRTEAEFFESHFISLYGTDKYFNVKKSDWGTSDLVPFTEDNWKEYLIFSISKSPNEQFKHILELKSFTKRQYCFARLNKLVGYKYKNQLNELLNYFIFDRNDNIARFDGKGQIIINIPYIGEVKYFDYEDVFVLPTGQRIKTNELKQYFDKTIESMQKISNIFKQYNN